MKDNSETERDNFNLYMLQQHPGSLLDLHTHLLIADPADFKYDMFI